MVGREQRHAAQVAEENMPPISDFVDCRPQKLHQIPDVGKILGNRVQNDCVEIIRSKTRNLISAALC